MEKKYISEIINRTPRPRSKRLREQGIGGAIRGNTIVSSGASGDFHTHLNKTTLDRISTDEDGYLLLSHVQEADGVIESVIEKVKAGYADKAGESAYAVEAYDLAKDSPTTKLIAGFASNFIPMVKNGSDISPTTWAAISEGAPLFAVKSVKGFFTEEFLSGRGMNPFENAGVIGATTLGGLEDVSLSSLKEGQALIYNGQKWVNQTLSQGLDTTQLAQYLTTNNYAKLSDIPSLADYAKKSDIPSLADYAKLSDIPSLDAYAKISDIPSLAPYLKSADAASTYLSKADAAAIYQPVGNYIMAHQPIFALTFAAGSFSAKVFTANSAALTVNIPTSTSHIAEGSHLYFTDARAQNALASTVTSINSAIALKLDADTFSSFKTGFDSWKSGIDSWKSTISSWKGTVDSFMSKFDSLFEKESDGKGGYRIKAKFAFYSVDSISAKGLNANASSGGSAFGLMRAWPATAPANTTTDALGANLGWELYQNKATVASVSALTARVAALEGKNYLNDLTASVTGSGNAITSVTQSADKKTLTFTKGTTFLTSHQTINHLVNLGRVASANVATVGDKKVTVLMATSSMASVGKPMADGYIMNFNWDTAYHWGTQVYIPNDNASSMQYRVQAGAVWNEQVWRTLLDTSNYATTLDARYALASSLANYVTLNTAQTITNVKTFNCVNPIGSSGFNVPLRLVGGGNGGIEVVGGKTTMGLGSHSNGNWYWWRGTDTPDATTNKSYVMCFDGASWDFFSNSIKANSFVKKNGTSSQVLMADGSVQTHWKASEITSASSDVGMITPLGMNNWTSKTFLKLSGGTMSNTNVVTNLNADLLDGLHYNNYGHILYNFNKTISLTQPYIHIVIGGYSSIESLVVIRATGNNVYSNAILHIGCRGDGYWGYQTSYNGCAVAGICKEVETSNIHIYVKLPNVFTSVEVLSPQTVTVDCADYSSKSYTAYGNSGLFGNRFAGNATSATNADMVDGVHASEFARGGMSAITVPAGNERWVRVASSTSYTFDGIITLVNHYYQCPTSGVSITVHGGYRSASYLSITQIGGNSSYFKKARIVYPTASDDPYYIEVLTASHPNGGNPIAVRLANSTNLNVITEYVAGSVPTGYATKELMLTTGMSLNGELVNTNANAFRMVQGNYGAFFRNDGGSTYLLLTNSGDQYGSWNNLRPLLINNANGSVSLGSGTLYVNHGGNVGVGTTSPTRKLDVNGNIQAVEWFRQTGTGGWHNETYDGGWFMQDSSWLRSYNSKGVFTGTGQIYTTSSVRIGDCTLSWDAANKCLHINTGVYSDSFVSAKGLNSSASGATSYNRLDAWSDYAASKADYVLSAKLGFDLYSNKADKSALSSYVTLASEQTISGSKTFSSPIVQNSNNANSWWLSASPRGKFVATNGGTASGWSPVLGFKTVSGKFELGALNDTAYFNFYNDSRSSNGIDVQLTFPKKSGTLAVTADIPTKVSQLTNDSGYALASSLSNYLARSGGSMTNTNVVSNLNADLLDGKHDGEVTAKKLTVTEPATVGVTVATAKTNLLNAVKGSAFGNVAKVGNSCIANWNNETVATVSSSAWSMINVTPQYDGDKYGQYLLFHYNASNPRLIGRNENTWSAMKTFAFLDDNVASATKLQTARTLWGQSFDGSSNVSGNMTGVGSIVTSGDVTVGDCLYVNGKTFYMGELMIYEAAGTVEIYNHTSNRSMYLRSNGLLDYDGGAKMESLKLSSICLECDANGSNVGGRLGEINVYDGSLFLQFDSDADVSLCQGGGNVQIGRNTGGVYKLEVDGDCGIYGSISSSVVSTSYINANKGAAIINSTAAAGAFTMLAKLNSTGGVFTHGVYGKEYKMYYTANSVINANTNSATANITLLDEDGRTKLNTLTVGSTAIYTDASGNTAFGSTATLTNAVHFRDNVVMGYANLYFTETANGSGEGLYFGMGTKDSKKYLGLMKHSARAWSADAFRFFHEGSLWVKSGIFTDGYVSARGQNTSSDARLKTRLHPFEMPIEKIAEAPSVSFSWLDGSPDLGSIAQYWQRINPLLTPRDHDRFLTLQYGKTALLCVISVAKKTLSLECRVHALEIENKQLKHKLELLESK